MHKSIVSCIKQGIVEYPSNTINLAQDLEYGLPDLTSLSLRKARRLQHNAIMAKRE